MGRSTYQFETPDVAKGLVFDTVLKTICMDAVFVANSSADDDMLDDVIAVLPVYRVRLFDIKYFILTLQNSQ